MQKVLIVMLRSQVSFKGVHKPPFERFSKSNLMTKNTSKVYNSRHACNLTLVVISIDPNINHFPYLNASQVSDET